MKTRTAFLLPAALLLGCLDQPASTEQRPADQQDTLTITAPRDSNDVVRLVPLTNSGVRFDGVYNYVDGKLEYYMRFFPRGNAAFVGGTEQYKGQLAELLTENVKSGWNQVHNCPVLQRNDSLFMRSMSIKGAINYYGAVRAEGDSVRFLKASEVTGTRIIAAYVFIPDNELGKK